MIGYAGSGYKGMQINSQEKTIEGDLFEAFVKAGAISKANADDPKKSSLVRCARTDKGVHAAGNVISLKLIVEDPDIVQSINSHLPNQIRVWGMERTNGSFSCYQTCDSRWYEYLIPTFSFIPPHPQSFLARKLVASAAKEGVSETYQTRQADAASFWETAEEVYVKPILDKLDPEVRANVLAAIHSSEEEIEPGNATTNTKNRFGDAMIDTKRKTPETKERFLADSTMKDEGDVKLSGDLLGNTDQGDHSSVETSVAAPSAKRKREDDDEVGPNTKGEKVMQEDDTEARMEPNHGLQAESSQGDLTGVMDTEGSKTILTPLEGAVKEVKAAYITAKKAYRISKQRRQRVQEALNAYIGTRNFHNYTIQKKFSDPSAKRVIRSFDVGTDPVIINDTEWLSLKVHGQSFMMHQIRKMVAMATLVVRCGSPLSIIQESYGPANISIPKAPGLGLLLERPVFDSYNGRAARDYSREKIDFDKYQKEMDEFKQREIYDRIFREEERDHQ